MNQTINLSQVPNDGAQSETEERQFWPSVMRGWRCRCPNCGAGNIFSKYLKVRDNCSVCDEDLSHQRADDGPAYMTIVVVGHILTPIMLFMFAEWDPDPMTSAAFLIVGFVALSLYLLPRFKGAFVGLQWAKRMHGFGKKPQE